MSESVDIGGHLALVQDVDEAADHYARRLTGSVAPVTRRLGAMAGPETDSTLRQWKERFYALDEQAARDVVGSPFFTYYWLQLLNACVRGDRAFVRAWSGHLARFVLVPHLRDEPDATVSLRLPEPTTEIRLPGAPACFTVSGTVSTLEVGPDGDGVLRDGTLRLPRAHLLGEGPDELGAVRRTTNRLIAGTRIEVSSEDPWIHRHLNSMNTKPPMEGYPAPDLEPLTPSARQLDDIDAAYRLIEEVWPALLPELNSYVRLFVPYRSAFHSSFTEACLMGAVFLSEAKHPFSSALYTAEHLLHEAAHLRLTLVEELDPLLTGAEETVFASPVRKDSRPLSAMLQTVFAFARIAAFHRHAHGATGSPAHAERHAESATLLRQGLKEVEAEPSLAFTAAGEKLWADMWTEADAS